MRKEILRYENIHCIQDNKKCINGLFMNVFEGEICGVMANNMREKDYFLQLMQGDLLPYYGWTYFEENKIVSIRAREHMQSQVAVISAKKGTYDELSVAENIFVSRRNVHWGERVEKLCRNAQELIDDVELKIDVGKKGYMLDEGTAKQVELLRAYVSLCKIVVITDVGMVMTENGILNFFNLVERLKRRGMTFIYLANSSTRLFDFADKIVILKKGRTIGFMSKNNFSRSQIYTQLYGWEKKTGCLENTMAENKGNRNTLEFLNVKLQGLPPLRFSVNAGEVLNILDCDDVKCHNLLNLLQGECEPESGYIMQDGIRISSHSIDQRIRKGIGFIESRPIEEMLFSEMTVLDNLKLMLSYRKKQVFAKKKYKKLLQYLVEDTFTEVELKSKVFAVSEECKLKVLYYKWIIVRPSVLVCVRPFASVDFQMRQLTVDLLQKVKKAGISVIILTTQPAEAYTMEGKNITIRNDNIEITK